jgi:hypothetical protein
MSKHDKYSIGIARTGRCADGRADVLVDYMKVSGA